MRIADCQKECHAITVSKGFNLNDHCKQLLLIGTEIAEAIDCIEIHETDMVLQRRIELFKIQSEVLENIRSSTNLIEKSVIRDHEHYAEELADIVIRVFSLSGAHNIDIEKAILDKMEVNRKRPPLHGKRF